jgi:hypothetical protein
VPQSDPTIAMMSRSLIENHSLPTNRSHERAIYAVED